MTRTMRILMTTLICSDLSLDEMHSFPDEQRCLCERI